jgi:hypothetical protein
MQALVCYLKNNTPSHTVPGSVKTPEETIKYVKKYLFDFYIRVFNNFYKYIYKYL